MSDDGSLESRLKESLARLGPRERSPRHDAEEQASNGAADVGRAARRLAMGQQPAAEQAAVSGSLGRSSRQHTEAEQARASGSSGESSKRSTSSLAREARRSQMTDAGAPAKVARLQVRIRVPLHVLSAMGAS